ncbi:gliding motility lipoprotein GldD [Aquimarina agarivorans]|uniref:gliding motility lipoprotein GldD n=1 Tax=Aquimarina agarivorans TaxID=980584 RepID=UPI000248FD64|nr:gliding motility lipoprotein GldD [Aquimarina agarivorans]
MQKNNNKPKQKDFLKHYAFTAIKTAGVFLGVMFCLISCKQEVLPKPKGMLSLEYDKPVYEKSIAECGFSFQKNKYALLKKALKKHKCGYIINYPNLNASMYLTYRAVNNDLRKLLTDAQNLTQEHVVKADEIIPKEYVNDAHKVYGMFYDVLGNAASQSQFYVTDSVRHFLLGSIYFNAKPNYDSIYPAAKYLQRDMRHLMETIRWEKDESTIFK